jgi:hypothetical protein
VDSLIGMSKDILQSSQGFDGRCDARARHREEMTAVTRIRFEDAVALGKNDLNMELDHRITDLRQKYATIERTITSSSKDGH